MSACAGGPDSVFSPALGIRRDWSALASALALLMIANAPRPASARAESALAALESEQQRLFARVAPSVVFINTRDGFGSGFVVSRDGLVLTNQHVVGAHKTVSVITHDGRRLTGVVIQRAGAVDLALVQLPLAQTRPLPLADSAKLRVGAWAGAVGHGRGGIWTFNTGMISNIYPAKSGRPVFQTQIPLNPGASGGPIFDRHGRVVGVVTSGIKDADAINFGIKIDVALAELDTLRARGDCITVRAPADVPVFIDGVMRGAGPEVYATVEPGEHELMVVLDGEQRRATIRFPQQREHRFSATATTTAR